MSIRDTSIAYWTEVQKALNKHGFLSEDAINGIRGSVTDAALVRFKQARGLKARPYIGPVTEKNLESDPIEAPANEPSWLGIARSYLGLKEIPGADDNEQILAWWTLIGAGWFDDDETPWCGAFVGGTLAEDGKSILPGSLAPRAREWENWGEDLSGPAVGAVVTFWRGSRSATTGHVAFVLGKTVQNDLVCIGGNQSNAVTIASFDVERVTSYRWPKEVARPATGFEVLPIMTSRGLSTNEA